MNSSVITNTPDWSAWVRHHATLFGMNSGPEREALELWAKLFAAHNRTPWEMQAASDRVFMNYTRPDNRFASQLQWREGHLHALKTALKDLDAVEVARRSMEQRQAIPGAKGNECGLCQGCGWVIVPRFTLTRLGNGSDVLGTCAVLCNCPTGAKNWESVREMDYWRRPWSLEQYEQRCRDLGLPDWRITLQEMKEQAAHDAEQARQRESTEGQAVKVTRRVDQLKGPLAQVKADVLALVDRSKP
jgi:ferredoxin